MTIENLKQIAIKYATTKGSSVPLAPDELCNAVVQYFNEFLKITADINTIQVAVTEEGGNIVFTITGNTLDGKAFTPIVITVDHNDFVTNQEFEEFKKSVTKQLNNKRNVISSPASSYVVYTQANGLESNLPYSELANKTSTNIMARRANGTSDVKKGISGENVANMQNIADVEAKINSALNNKLDKITSPISNAALYANINGNDRQISYEASPIPNTISYRDATGKTSVVKGVSGQNVANMENIADVEAKIPDVSNFATKSELSEKLDKTGGTINGNLTVSGNINTAFYKSRGAEVIDLDFSNNRFNVGNTRYGINIFSSNRPTVTIGESISNIALENDIPKYTTVDSVIYDTTNGAIIAYNGANEIHIPLLAGENVTIDASEDNKKIVISTDVIKEPIYFISFYANAPGEPCHLMGTMMSKNTYGTGQKTIEEFAVLLADNFYGNSNEGLAVYGRLAEKNIICIYSDDGLAIRCLDEENCEVYLPTVMFFITETEL